MKGPVPQTHQVRITREALDDLERIAGYIRGQAPKNAATVAARLVDAIDSLAFMPGRFKEVGRSRKRGSPIHGMVVRPFIIYYRIDEQQTAVFVLNIVHGARRQPKRFE
jgi:plasmid stabilization system protein ParE